MPRYESTNAIVGQFLPKIYTRRITIEDVGLFSRKQSGTAVTIDYQIKDILDENGLGVITQNSDGGTQLQDEVLSALKVGIIAFGDAETGQRFARDILALTQLDDVTAQVDFESALYQIILGYTQIGKPIAYQFNDARPAELGFQFRNTIYQQYDIDNNVINIIPYSHTFKFDNFAWDDCNNVSVLCFTYFDFNSLGLSSAGLTDSAARKLGYMIGDLTYDIVTSDGKVKSTATIYKDVETGTPYYGPVHYHSEAFPAPDGYVGYMAGRGGDDMGPKLRQVQVPVTKIQDFRSFQRTQMVNYQPPQLEYFNTKSPSLSFVEKRNKNFFKLTDVVVDYDYEEKHTNIDFTVDMKDIYKNNSRYYDLLNSLPSLFNILPSDTLLEILEIKILRRRMTRDPIITNRIGGYKRAQYLPDSEPEHVVAKSTQTRGGFSIVEKTVDGVGSIKQTDRDLRTKSFYACDLGIEEYDGSNAVFQYGVELKLLDTTKNYFIGRVERARRSLDELKRYAEESKIPVFNSYYVNKPEENAPIGLSEDPSYSEVARGNGNYDAKTNTFTMKFKDEARAKYNFAQYVQHFRELALLSSGKSDITIKSREGSLLQSDDTLQTPLSALQSLDALSDLQDDSTASRQFLINMLDPGNARPETIDSFIKSFQDLVLEMEDYFGVDHVNTINNEGAGYSAKADYGFTVQRWFNSTDKNVDISTFVVMSPASQRIFFDYLPSISSINSARTSPASILSQRVITEQEDYSISDESLATISPTALNIGDFGIFFKQEELDRKKEQDRIERLRPNTKKRKKERLSRKKYILLDSSDLQKVAAVNTFVTHIQKLESSGGEQATFPFMNAINQSSLSSFYSMLNSLNDEIVDNSVLYGYDVIKVDVLTNPLVENILPVDPNDCGLTDNTPKQFKLPDITKDFLAKQDILRFGYAQNVKRLKPLVPSPELQQIAPQISSTDFPSGGIFDKSLRIITAGKTPLNMSQVKNVGLVDTKKLSLATIDEVSSNILTTELVGVPEVPSSAPMPKVGNTKLVPSSFATFEVVSDSPVSQVPTPTTPTPTPTPQPTPTVGRTSPAANTSRMSLGTVRSRY